MLMSAMHRCGRRNIRPMMYAGAVILTVCACYHATVFSNGLLKSSRLSVVSGLRIDRGSSMKELSQEIDERTESPEHLSSSVNLKNKSEKKSTDKVPATETEVVVHTRLHFQRQNRGRFPPVPAKNEKQEAATGLKKKGKVPVLMPAKEEVPAPDLVHAFPIRYPTRYSIDRKAFQRYAEYLGKTEALLPPQDKAVIILTNHRSGSSFFGELFNQHPDAFYIFEPLLPLSNSSQCSVNSDLKVQILKKLVQCELPNWMEIYKGIPLKNQMARNNGNLRQCMRNRMCFRHNTKEMCEDAHCPRSDKSSFKSCISDCGAINPVLVNNHCRMKKMVALKLIRLCNILDLEGIIKTIPTDIKVIHLLRDPRGIISSRMNILRKFDIKQSIHGTCQRQMQNVMSALVNTPEWLKGRYMVLRYEDAALSPYETAQSVYDFVGLNFLDEMKQWIFKNTKIEFQLPVLTTAEYVAEPNGTSESHRTKRQISKRLPKKREPGHSPYGTKRNSTEIVQKWARHLRYTTVKLVEGVCSGIMKMAGYTSIGTPDQYAVKKDTSYFSGEIEILKKQV